MVTPESLQKRCAKLDIVDLMEIVANPDRYTPMAVNIAQQEVKKREIPEDVVEQYTEVLSQIHQPLSNDYLSDLKFWQKLLFYVIWVPHIRPIIEDFIIEDGQILREQQKNYYSFTGFFALFIAIGINFSFVGPWFFGLWILLFLLLYLFDVGYNRDRQIRDIEKRVQEGKPSNNQHF